MSIKYFCRISILISILFFVVSLYFYKIFNGGLYFEKALTLTFSALGSIGTIASIIFALYVYNKQQDEQKKLIESNQPMFMLSTSTLEKSNDSTGQPSYSFDISVKNFGHIASSFSLVDVGSADNLDDKIIVEIPDAFVSLFDRDDSYDFKVNISNVFDIQSHPDIDNIGFDLLLSYVDKFNSSKYKVYALSINIDGKPKLMSVKDHHLLSFNN